MALKLVALAISTLGYLAFLASVLKIRPLLTPLVWAGFVTTFVYAFGIAGHLALGADLALALGIALGLATAWRNRHHLPKPCSDWLWALPYLIPLVVAYQAIPNDFVFLVWDEVGTWAKTQKLVFDTNSLLTADSPIAIKSYPPGQIVFQYYITRMAWWSEKHVLFAQMLFVFCALMGTVGALVTRKGWAAIVYLTLIPVIYFFHFDYTTIYADPLLAVVFAACLAMALRPRAGPRDDLALAICLCGFVLLKDMAVVFTALVVAIYVVNIAIGAERASSPPARAGQAGMAVLICGLAVGLVLRSWKWYVSTIDTSTTSFSPISIDSFTQEAFLARFGKTVTAFIHQLIKPEYFASDALLGRFGGSLAQVMTALVLLGLVITAVAAGRRRVVAFIATQAIFAGAIGYLLFLLWLYLAFFTEYEGVRVASFERYSMTYLLAWLLVAYTLLISELARFRSKWISLIPIAGLVLTFGFAPAKFISDAQGVPIDAASLEKMKKAKALAEEVKKHVKPGERVYFLAQNSNGYERHLFDYAMVPYPHSECWSVGKKYNDGDVWTCDRPLGLLVKDYDYLAIYHADDRFWNDNRAIFSAAGQDRESGVYKISRHTDGRLELSPAQ
ncbi:MAG: hypothetical protein WCP99_08520 [Burkholderiales bacterium]